MNNYQLVKNTEWKEVEINNQLVEIPNDWNVQKIGEKIKFNRGGTPIKNEENYSGDLPWITISNLTEKYISNYTAKIKKEKNTKTFKSGTLLGSFKMSVGRFAFATEECSTNEGIMGFHINESIHNSNYLYYTFPNLFIANALPNQQGVLLLNTEIINNIEFICPSLKVQSSLASILSTQESIIQNIESLISKYESRFQYLSEELLSGRLRVKEVDGQTVLYKNDDDNWKEVEVNGEIKEIPCDWEVDNLKKIAKLCTGNTPSTKEKSFWHDKEGIKWISTPDFRNVKNGYIAQSSRFLTLSGAKIARICPKNTLLVSCIATIGDVGLLSEDSAFNQQINAILPNENVDTIYLKYYFINKKDNFINYAPESVVKIINKELFGQYEIHFPIYSQQLLINSIISSQEELIQKQKEYLIKEKQKFDWLLANLLSGKYLVK